MARATLAGTTRHLADYAIDADVVGEALLVT